MKILLAQALAFWLICAHAADDSPPPDLWANLRSGFTLTEPDDSSGIQALEDWYADHPKSIETLAENGRRYLYYIVSEVEKRGMPTEIALVPMIESGFNPLVYSRYHAAGLWQMLPGTGRHFGLHLGKRYDGRRDVVAATDAALDYLAHLHDLFGDWELAIAAYNAGEGTLTRALNRNRAKGLETGLSNLALPNETKRFCDKLFALRNVLEEPEKFGIELSPIPDVPYFTNITAKQDIDVRAAARLAGIPLSEFAALNPGITGPVWSAKDAQSLLLPTDKADAFESRLGALPSPENSGKSIVYSVRKGDTLIGIARRFGVSASDIQRENGISAAKHLRAGARLVLVQRPTPQ